MKTRKERTLATHTKKALCALLTPCILLSSCQKSAEDSPQDLAQDSEKLTSTPQATQSIIPTPTAVPKLTPTDAPIQTPTDIPTPTPTPTPTSIPLPTRIPEPTPVWAMFPEDYMDTERFEEKLSPEMRDTITALDFSADKDAYPQLFARFQGLFSSPRLYYHIDLIALDLSWSNILIHIRTRSSSYKFEGETLADHYYYHEYHDLGDAYNIFNIVDLNNDGYDDFILDIGLNGMRNYSALFFLFNPETEIYEPLRGFSNATYDTETGIIYEFWHNGHGIDFRYKYRVEGNELILLESLCDEPDSLFTWKRYENGEEIIVREHAPNKEIDMDEWPNPDYDRRVK